MEVESEYDQEEKGKAMLGVFLGRLCHHWKWFVSSSLLAVCMAIAEAVGVVIPVWLIAGMVLAGVFVAAFFAWKDEYLARVDALKLVAEKQEVIKTEKEAFAAKLKAIEDERVELSVAFVGPDPQNILDPVVGACTFRIKVENNHPTKTANNVRVHLRKVDCENWVGGKKPELLHPITEPHDFVLPLANTQQTGVGHEIYPGVARFFDLLFVKFGEQGAGTVIGMAPFHPPQRPMVNWPLSIHGFFPITGLLDEVGSTLQIAIYVTCDDCETLEYSVELRVPSVREGTIPEFVNPAYKLTVRRVQFSALGE